MCMITQIPAGLDIPVAGIENGSIMNNDGHGWAVASRKGIEVGKSMNFDEAISGLIATRAKHGTGAIALFHSRFATHGTVDEFNVHPFFAGTETVLAHNGILPLEWHPYKGDKRSDTRILVDETVTKLLNENGLPSRRMSKSLGKAIGSGNKLVILTAANGEPKARIINAHLGKFTEGVWFSNDGYLPSKYEWYGKWRKESVAIDNGYAAEEDCEVCEAKGTVDVDSAWCSICAVCNYCWYDSKFCQCWWNQPKELEAGYTEDLDAEDLDWNGSNYDWENRRFIDEDTLNPQLTIVRNPNVIG